MSKQNDRAKPISRVIVYRTGLIRAIRIGSGIRTHLAPGRYKSEGVFANGMHVRGESGDKYIIDEKDLLAFSGRGCRLYRAAPPPFVLPPISEEGRAAIQRLLG